MWGEDASAVVLDTCKETSKRKQPGASKPSAYVGKLAFCASFQISLNDLQQSILMTWATLGRPSQKTMQAACADTATCAYSLHQHICLRHTFVLVDLSGTEVRKN